MLTLRRLMILSILPPTLIIAACVTPQTREELKQQNATLQNIQAERIALQAKKDILTPQEYEALLSALNSREQTELEKLKLLKDKANQEIADSAGKTLNDIGYSIDAVIPLLSAFFPVGVPLLGLVRLAIGGAASALITKPKE